MMKSEKINAYVATLAVWNVKLHNIHWNVEGHLFKGIHEYTESLYDRAAEQYDETAEILKMRGEMPVATIAESLKASVIEELPSRRRSRRCRSGRYGKGREAGPRNSR